MPLAAISRDLTITRLNVGGFRVAHSPGALGVSSTWRVRSVSLQNLLGSSIFFTLMPAYVILGFMAGFHSASIILLKLRRGHSLPSRRQAVKKDGKGDL